MSSKMKKMLMFLLLLLGLAGSGAGYYFLYYLPEQEALQADSSSSNDEEQVPTTEAAPKTALPPKPLVNDLYVDLARLGVREKPDAQAFVERVLYRGDKVKILERKAGFGRITDYFVYEENGPEVAEWIPLDGLVEQPPVISAEERRKTVTQYIANSDDFKLYETAFVQKTDELLKNETCVPEDFEELGGWVKSLKYQEREVYFVYCGGRKLANKIYFDIQSKEIFYASH